MYCETCGKELEKWGIKGYDMLTGEPKYKLRCPSGICGHEGIKHELEAVTTYDIEPVLGEVLFKCIKCNHYLYMRDL